MKKLLYIIMVFSFFICCKKENVLEKYKDANCRTCNLVTYKNNSFLLLINFNDWKLSGGDTNKWCNYLDTINKGPFTQSNGDVFTKIVNCN